LEAYISSRYSEAGGRIPPPFAEDFGLERFDDDVREAEILEQGSRSLTELLADFSYDDVIIPNFVATVGDTLPRSAETVVLLYDYQHTGRVTTEAQRAVSLRFVGVVPYE